LCYVDEFAGGAGDGSSWADAYTGVHDALADLNCSEIWVADGSYAAGATMSLRNGVALYGGFAGGETARDERDWETNISTLSGEDSYRVLESVSNNSTAVLDGFTIRDGYEIAFGLGGSGGGLLVDGGSPTLRNLVFQENRALRGGGMVVANGANVYLFNARFANNDAIQDVPSSGGGGVMVTSSASIHLDTTTFISNRSVNRGDAVFAYNGSLQISNSTFENNEVLSRWPIACEGSGGLSTVSNTTFINTLANVRVLCNEANYQNVTAFHTILHGETMSNSIVWDAGAQVDTITDSIVQGGCPGSSTCTNVIDSDPLLGSLQDNDGPTYTMALGSGSPALNAGGVNAACAAEDQRGVPRSQGAGCDIGAYEAIVEASGPLCYVDDDITWAGNGISWAEAYQDLQHALFNSACTEIWVAEGTYTPDGAGPGDPSYSFVLQNGVAIYGGFTRNGNPAERA